jgi:hypothetical protein
VSIKLEQAFWTLRLGLGVTAFLAGADKFTNLLTKWEKYLAPEAKRRLAVSGRTFMGAVGIIEMLVGIGILSPRSTISSYAASAWLLSIALNPWLNEDYDIAVRDLNMALAAYALARLSAAHEKQRNEDDLVDRSLSAA